jgi:hypothetical protein
MGIWAKKINAFSAKMHPKWNFGCILGDGWVERD